MEQLPLKDIHAPPDASWWPPAPGWIALALLLPLLCYAIVYIYRRMRRKTAIKAAKRVLLAIKNDKSAEGLQTLIALSALLRRTAITTSRVEGVAGLSGSAWLAYLDSSFSDQPFSQGVGRCLADVQYRPQLVDNIDFNELFKLCERWLQRQKVVEPAVAAKHKRQVVP
jgi:hypothetical protein